MKVQFLFPLWKHQNSRYIPRCQVMWIKKSHDGCKELCAVGLRCCFSSRKVIIDHRAKKVKYMPGTAKYTQGTRDRELVWRRRWHWSSDWEWLVISSFHGLVRWRPCVKLAFPGIILLVLNFAQHQRRLFLLYTPSTDWLNGSGYLGLWYILHEADGRQWASI